jgi:tetratricopeptide (TPR) repeat protein
MRRLFLSGWGKKGVISRGGRRFKMKEPYRTLLLIVCIILFFSTICFFSCRPREQSEDINLLYTLVEMNNPEYRGQPVSDKAIEEVRNVLKRYEEAMQKEVEDAEELASLYKRLATTYLEIDLLEQAILEKTAGTETPLLPGSKEEQLYYHEGLALKFLDINLYRNALEHLEKAIEITPENDLLFYYAGLCAGNIGVSYVTTEDYYMKQMWFDKAEAYYKRSLELNPNYRDTLFGLAVLLAYERNRPGEALTYIKQIIAGETEDIDAMFLLANTYIMLGRYEEAVIEFDNIASTSKIESVREQALKNKEQVIYFLEHGEQQE